VTIAGSKARDGSVKAAVGSAKAAVDVTLRRQALLRRVELA